MVCADGGRNMGQSSRNGEKRVQELGAKTAERVAEVVEVMRREYRHEEVVRMTQAAGGLGLLFAAALVGAVRRVGAWRVIDRIESFLRSSAAKVGDVPTLSWTLESINWVRTGALDLRVADADLAEMMREGYQRELERRASGPGVHWLATVAAHLGEMAAWAAWSERDDCEEPLELQEVAFVYTALEIAAVVVAAAPRSLRGLVRELDMLDGTNALPTRTDAVFREYVDGCELVRISSWKALRRSRRVESAASEEVAP